MPTLIITHPDGTQQEQVVDVELTIGRAEGNDLVLAEGGVSRKHARFFVEGQRLLVEDIGSANGTWVDGERVEAPTALQPGSQVIIGDYELELRPSRRPLSSGSPGRPQGMSGAPSALKRTTTPRATRVVQVLKPTQASSMARRQGPRAAKGPQLRGLSASVNSKIFPLSGTMSVGRGAGAALLVEDDSISRRHAELVVTDSGVHIKDLGSANGTTVNSDDLEGDVELKSGDVVQFGVVEFMFEDAVSAKPTRAPLARRTSSPPRVRRTAPLAPLPSDTLDGEEGGGAPGRSGGSTRRILLISVGVLGALVAAVGVKSYLNRPVQSDVPLKSSFTKDVVDAAVPEEIDELLAQCRSYASSERGRPNWEKAEQSCQRALELEPIHAEANALVKRIAVLKVCEAHSEKAKDASAAGQLEDALEAYAKIGKDCESYFLEALAAARPTVAEVKKKAAADCKSYAGALKWELALRRCELYIRLSCQTMEPKDLYPGIKKLKLEGPLRPDSEWRPTDLLYLNFLKARERLTPGQPTWVCPEIAAFRPPPPPPDPARATKEELMKRFPDPEMGRALVLYLDGDPGAAVPLQKVIENMSKASMHEGARALLLEINNATNLYENGTTHIMNDRPDKAEPFYHKALEVDEKLILGPRAQTLSPDEKRLALERSKSFVRATIVKAMGDTCYSKGKGLADRKDWVEACRFWKLGLSFSRSHLDLLKAVTNVCTPRAAAGLEGAASCSQLETALRFAVDGDGLREKIRARQDEEGCK